MPIQSVELSTTSELSFEKGNVKTFADHAKWEPGRHLIIVIFTQSRIIASRGFLKQPHKVEASNIAGI